MQIDIAVFDGVDEMDALGPYEVLRSAAVAGADLNVRLVTLRPEQQVMGAFGLRFVPDATYDATARLLVIPGGGWVNRASRGAWTEAQRGDWPRTIAAAHQAGTLLASVCTGAMLLAHSGVLSGRRATTHHAAKADLADFGVEVVDRRVVDDGDIITAGGVTSGLDLAFHLIARFSSRSLAGMVARRMEYAPVPVR